MAQLEFAFNEFIEEIDAIRAIASEKFLDPQTIHFVLPAIKTHLENIRHAETGRVFSWEIPEHMPIRTNISCGGYQPDWNGEHNVIAEVSSIWDIMPLGDHRARNQIKRRFSLQGKASTKTRILKKMTNGSYEQLALWRVEIGDARSPGFHFHYHLPSEHIDVPRLPAFLATPMVALEYVLGEIFQDEWKKVALKDDYHVQKWRSIQEKRIVRVIEWQKNTLENTIGSPLVILKALKPDSDLFTK